MFAIGSVKYDNIYNDFDCVEEYGEAINDAKVKRNRAVEEKYNITLDNMMENNVTNLASAVTRSVQSGTHVYDLVLSSFEKTFAAALNGELYAIGRPASYPTPNRPGGGRTP